MDVVTGNGDVPAATLGTGLFGAPAIEPSAMVHVTLMVLVVLGVALWLLGRSITRPLCAASGLLLGAAATLALARLLGSFDLYLVFIMVGAVIGCLMAWFLFRLWMGLSLTIALAIVAPIAALQWMEPDPRGEDDVPKLNLAPLIESSTTPAESQTVAERIENLCRQVSEQFGEWWNRQPGSGKTTMVIGAATGAAIGLFFGMLAPYWSSSGLSALLGTLMVVAALTYWVDMAGWTLPAWLWRPQSQTIGVGLITLVGMLVQWTFFRARPD